MSDSHYHALVKEPEENAPLVFAFHGTGGDENQFFGLAEQLLPSAGIISPRGDVSEQGAARFFRRTGEGVYDMDDLAVRTEAMAGFVRGYKEKYPTAEIYGFGYSNGANILASVVMTEPGLFDRIGLLHPLIPWEPKQVSGLRDKQVLISAGMRDPICPWPLSDRLISWFHKQGAVVTTDVHDGGHELRQSEIAALVRLMGFRVQA